MRISIARARRRVDERVDDERPRHLQHPFRVPDRPHRRAAPVSSACSDAAATCSSSATIIRPICARSTGSSTTRELARVDPREVEQVRRQPRQPVDLALHRREELASRVLVELLVREQLEEAAEREERRPQLVRGVGDELLARVVELREPHPHAVEAERQLADLVVARGRRSARRSRRPRCARRPPRDARRRWASIPAAVSPSTSARASANAGREQQPPLDEPDRRQRVGERGAEEDRRSPRSTGDGDLGEVAGGVRDPAALGLPDATTRSAIGSSATSRERWLRRESSTTVSVGGVIERTVKTTTRAFVAAAKLSTASCPFDAVVREATPRAVRLELSSWSSRASTSCRSSDGTTIRYAVPSAPRDDGGESERQPNPDPARDLHSGLNRYPAPRIVRISSGLLGSRSIFSRRCRTCTSMVRGSR